MDQQIKIYSFGESDYIAASNKEEAIKAYRDYVEADEEYYQCEELTPEEMKTTKWAGDDWELEEPISFEQELKNRIDAGQKFPQFFASTES